MAVSLKRVEVLKCVGQRKTSFEELSFELGEGLALVNKVSCKFFVVLLFDECRVPTSLRSIVVLAVIFICTIAALVIFKSGVVLQQVTESYDHGPPLSLSKAFASSTAAEKKNIQVRRQQNSEVNANSLRSHHKSIYDNAMEPAGDLSDLLKTVKLADIPILTPSQVKRALVCPLGKLCSFVASGKSKGTSKTVEFQVKRHILGLIEICQLFFCMRDLI
jgi:hypothetical protein